MVRTTLFCERALLGYVFRRRTNFILLWEILELCENHVLGAVICELILSLLFLSIHSTRMDLAWRIVADILMNQRSMAMRYTIADPTTTTSGGPNHATRTAADAPAAGRDGGKRSSGAWTTEDDEGGAGASRVGRSLSPSGAVRLLLQDDREPLDGKQFRMWAKLIKFPVAPAQVSEFDAALRRRDAVTMRRMLRVAVHRCCTRIRITSQRHDGDSSGQVVWVSRWPRTTVEGGGPHRSPGKQRTLGEPANGGGSAYGAIVRGPRLPLVTMPDGRGEAPSGSTTMSISLDPDVLPWVGHVPALFPWLVRDDALNDAAQGRSVQTAMGHGRVAVGGQSPSTTSAVAVMALMGVGGLTPCRGGGSGPDVFNASLLDCSQVDICDSPLQATTITGPGHSPEIQCCVCERGYPAGLILFLEQCCHPVCIRCASACAIKHVAAPCATTRNCPCPATDCELFFLPSEVRTLLCSNDFESLETTEVIEALCASGVRCPQCGSVFERLPASTSSGQSRSHKPSSKTSSTAGGAKPSPPETAPASLDPLAFRFMCQSCNIDFCESCGVFPYHHGKPCRVYSAGPPCRYCGNPATNEELRICAAAECVTKAERSCVITKPCGHLCHGSRGEKHCCPCLHSGCGQQSPIPEEDDVCGICYVDCLREAPCLQLDCGHIFHTHCLEDKLHKKWPTARVTFKFLECPLCCVPMSHPLLTSLVTPIMRFRDMLESRYLERLRIERLLPPSFPQLHNPFAGPAPPGGAVAVVGAPPNPIADASSKYFNNPLLFARENLTYYQCHMCTRPYFGGLKSCIDVDRPDPNREELICGGCSAGSVTCEKHGHSAIEFKCKYCCNIAVWFCWGTTHFCELCHSPPRKTVRAECPGEELCPLKAKHLPNGKECAIGCVICRSELAA